MSRAVNLSRYGEDIAALISAAVDAVEALDKYADADQPAGSQPIPNAAMSAQMELEAVLMRLKVLPIPRHQASREKLIDYVKTGGNTGRTVSLARMKPEHLTDDQLRVLADDIAINLRFEQRINRRNRAQMEAEAADEENHRLELEEQQHQEEMRALENQEMDRHFREHPHG